MEGGAAFRPTGSSLNSRSNLRLRFSCFSVFLLPYFWLCVCNSVSLESLHAYPGPVTPEFVCARVCSWRELWPTHHRPSGARRCQLQTLHLNTTVTLNASNRPRHASHQHITTTTRACHP